MSDPAGNPSRADRRRGTILVRWVIVWGAILLGIAWWMGFAKKQREQAALPDPPPSPPQKPFVVPPSVVFANLALVHSSPVHKVWRGGSANIAEAFSMRVSVRTMETPAEERLASEGVGVWLGATLDGIISAKTNDLKVDWRDNRLTEMHMTPVEHRSSTNDAVVENSASFIFGDYTSVMVEDSSAAHDDSPGRHEFAVHAIFRPDVRRGFLLECERTRRGLFGSPGVPEVLDQLRAALLQHAESTNIAARTRVQ